ncbi:hypothetical protein Svir_07260 [Saccharomonospora viridis DSM 43017]|uniref:Uncharacterized protein n=2 Tax=Saccharomonospora viridis TaxID=1852 RepID=C7MWD6_SACVD|nr:hypothetical protein Svir_07260 [Saccharomonospora viridis DSM 43017]
MPEIRRGAHRCAAHHTPGTREYTMTTMTLATLAQGELGTENVRDWILDNIIPLVLLAVALLLLWLGGGKGDNAGVMRRLAGVVIALAIVGLAVSGLGVDVGEWLASLFTNPS